MIRAASADLASPTQNLLFAVAFAVIGSVGIISGLVELRDREARRPSSLPRWLRSSPWLASPRLMIFVSSICVVIALVLAVLELIRLTNE
ncbi:hypothetical protein [Micromonospora sp. KC213]|uniref:hypothetical protein n=1 Tax=Micromonospora sp. KC213 TaxID=2530378 RepID=UPI0010514E71|nr:hypothetical protein [Micromonospora sp. KC213]TDC36202.1 hypothetical protein E1166_22495 [Micromonospora sp. KC213]